MNRLVVPALIAVVGSVPSVGGDINPFEGPRPLVVLLESNPWQMVVGSDTPSLVIYEDGQVVFVKETNGHEAALMWVQLGQEQLRTLKAEILDFGGFTGIKKQIVILPGVSDQSETKLFVDIDGKGFTTSVYGPVLGDWESMGLLGTAPAEVDKVPDKVKRLYTFLKKMEFRSAKIWIPKYVEAMVWGYEYAPDASIHWPKKWPGLASSSSFKRGESYSIFLPGSEADALRAFLRSRREEGAVEIDGHKWSVEYRYTYPSEPIWRKAFDAAR